MQSLPRRTPNPFDLVPLDHPDVYTLQADLTDSGQVFNAFSSLFSMIEDSFSSYPVNLTLSCILRRTRAT